MSDLFKGVGTSNFGNSATVSPAQAPGQAPDGFGLQKTVVKFPGSARIDNVAQEADPAVVTASVYATPTPDGNLQAGGPITGIALWGTGDGGIQTAEFDIPVITGASPAVFPPTSPFSGGTLISVPATSLEIRARNDQNLIPPPIGAVVSQPIGNTSGGDVIVTASIGKGTKSSFFRATRTIWAANGLAGVGLAPTDSSIIIIPPFAASFRVMRSNTTVATPAGAFSVALGTTTRLISDGFYTVAAGTLSPEIILSGQETIVVIENTGAQTFDQLAVIFYLAI